MRLFLNYTASVVALAVVLSYAPQRAVAAQSLVMNPTVRIQAQLSGDRRFAALGDWRIEGLADQWTSHGTRVGLWEIDSTATVEILADNSLLLHGFHDETLTVPLGSSKSFRWVGQRNVATGKYTLEAWDQQSGAYHYAECPVKSKSAIDRRNYRMSIGSFYEPAGPDVHLGYLRWYSTTRPTGGPPPLPSLPAGLKRDSPLLPDLMDLEFEGQLRDSSGSINLNVQAGKIGFTATTAWPPSINLGATPLTVRAGKPVRLDASSSFSNAESPALNCHWEEVSAPVSGTWSEQNTCSAHYTPSKFGTYNLRVTVKDSEGQSSSRSFKLGSVVTTDNDIVVVDDPRMDMILGPMVRFGANPWNWFDDRQKKLADNQIALMNSLWKDYWNVPDPHGTITVTRNSAVVTGNGTTFQTDFCGGPGNTTPVATSSLMYIWYKSTDYPGQTGRGRYVVVKCDSQTQVTINNPYVHGASDSGLSYTVVDPQIQGTWAYSPIPANYYDNVLAFYNLYYRSGIDTYLNAARTLASRFWTGPNWDRGQDYNSTAYGGNFSVAGPGRGQSVTGLILWSIDTGTDIWKGVHYVWDYWILFSHPSRNGGQMGNVREHGYFIGGLALCALFDQDKTYAQERCPAALHTTLTTLWKPLQTADGVWTNTETGTTFLWPDGTVSVNVVDGSPNITLHNAKNAPLTNCPNRSDWCAQAFTNDKTPFDRWLWFINDPKNLNVAGNKSSDAGDTRAYKIASVLDGRHASLTVPYQSGKCPAPRGCEKGLSVSHMVGFGTQPFTLGLANGVMADYVYKALVFRNMNDDADLVKQFVRAASKWLATTGYDPSTGGLWGARGFLNCEPNPSIDLYCTSSPVLNGEAMRGYAAGFMLTRDPAILAAGDRLYQAQWCKPTGGWTCPIKPGKSYLSDIDDPPAGYMLGGSFLLNKWLGFFFGYGFGSAWPAARTIGSATAENHTFIIPVQLPASAVKARATVMQISGAHTQTVCSGSPCEVTADVRQGRPIVKIDYLNNAGKVVASSGYSYIEREN